MMLSWFWSKGKLFLQIAEDKATSIGERETEWRVLRRRYQDSRFHLDSKGYLVPSFWLSVWSSMKGGWPDCQFLLQFTRTRLCLRSIFSVISHLATGNSVLLRSCEESFMASSQAESQRTWGYFVLKKRELEECVTAHSMPQPWGHRCWHNIEMEQPPGMSKHLLRWGFHDNQSQVRAWLNQDY